MNGARKALIVSSDTYDHEGLRDLRSPQADASALAAVLGDPGIGDFEVDVVHNEPSYLVQARVEELFAESRPDDLLLLHLSCHGLKSESGELFFAARNTRLGRLESTAVPAHFVQRCMRSSRSRSIVLLLDCCYGGAFGAGVAVRAAGSVDVAGSLTTGRLEGGRGRAVITASSAMEYAFEGERLADDHSAPSVFTDALVRGLTTGEADRDEDGWVSLNELYDYVFDQVRTSTPGQTPTRDVEMQGELYLARSRRMRVQPAPVPPDLLAASHDPSVFSRLGAVSELRSRLLGAHLPAAAGAHQRLAEMAELDIRYVAEAAAAAVQEAGLALNPLDLDFGHLEQGSPSPQLRVTASGPPLARAYVAEPSDSRIQVTSDADGLSLSVDTSTPGRVDGTVRVRSPLGEYVIQVHADVTHWPLLGSDGIGPAPPVVSPAPQGRPHVSDAVGPRSGHGQAREPTHLPDTAEDRPDPSRPADGDRRARLAGALVLAGAGMLLLGLTGNLRHETPWWVSDDEWSVYTLLLAVLVAAAGLALLVPRTRWHAGPGLALGVLAAVTWNLVALLTEWQVDSDEGELDPGFWLVLAGHVVLVVAGVVVARAAVTSGAGLGAPLVPAWLLLALVAAGAAAGLAVLVSATRDDGSALYWSVPAWVGLTAAAAPVVVAFARPAWFGFWLLVGWTVGAVPGAVRYVQENRATGGDQDADAARWLLVAVLALVPLAVVLAVRATRSAPARDTAPAG